MVAAWPERAPVYPGELTRAHLRMDEAIRMTSAEAMCLRNRGTPWTARDRRVAGDSWSLMRHMPDRTLWYVDDVQKFRRAATVSSARAWRDDPAVAEPWNGTEDDWTLRYRDLGPMELPEGALIRTAQGYALYFNNEFHFFASESLAFAAGYPLSRAVEMADADLVTFGSIGEPLTAQVFTVCPLAMSQARRDDDEDGDGAPRARDCDDHDSRRAPHLIETCDDIDNNCDGITDEGFAVGLPCDPDHGCHLAGITACSPDGWSVMCKNEDALCE